MALKAEAQAFVDRYKLQKSRIDNFIIYKGETILLIVSGIGVESCRVATQTLINHFDIEDDDIFVNIGVCGADISYDIGELIEIGAISYDEILYVYDKDKKSIVCVDFAVDKTTYDIVDMESYGFYDAVIHNPAIKKFKIYKVVSDHFEPQKVTKDFAKKLIADRLEEIF